MDSSDLVSVVIPAHNRPEMTLRAVDSALDQAYANLELIVVDDGSTEAMGNVQRRVEGAGQQYVRTPNRGPGPARNLGGKLASGRWLAFLDSDDLWLPEKVEAQVAYLWRNPRTRLAQAREIWYRQGVRVNPPRRHEMTEGDLFSRSCRAVCISSSSVMIQSDLFHRLGGFDEDLLVCEDYDLWLRAAATHRVGLVEERLVVKYGGHGDQLSRRYPAMDRFRLYSLVRLLLCDLTDRQREAALRAAVDKSRILALGAEKKGRPSAPLYRNLHNRLSEEASQESLKRVLELLADRLGPEA